MIKHQPNCNDIFEPGLMHYNDALANVLKAVYEIQGVERIAIGQARGRIVHTPIRSSLNVPAHTNSAVDGFAIYSDDIPMQVTRQLVIKGLALAGKVCTDQIKPGECLRIMTGAAMPENLNTVIMQEHVEISDDKITIDSRINPGQNVRAAGEDIQQGETVLEPGKYLTPADIGLIASLGVAEINVKRKLRIAIASTGDEIFGLGEQPDAGGIYDSNRYSLMAALTRPDIEFINLGIIKDNPDQLLATLNDAGQYADLIISSGGVSVGEADYTKAVLEQSGRVNFWKIAIKPGRPMAFGHIGKAAFFGLPGNPVAVMVTYYFFVLPALEKMLGFRQKPLTPTFQARTTENLRKKPGRTEFYRGIVSLNDQGEWHVRTTGKQGSGILKSMSLANAFIILDHDASHIEAGTWVNVKPFSDFF